MVQIKLQVLVKMLGQHMTTQRTPIILQHGTQQMMQHLKLGAQLEVAAWQQILNIGPGQALYVRGICAYGV